MKRILGYLLLAISLLAIPIVPASAQLLQGNPGYIPNLAFEGVANLSNTSYTNATTTPTILPGTAITLPAIGFDPNKRLVQVCYSADVTKNTGGTGQIAVAQDGNPIATSYRYSSSAAGRNTISECFSFFRGTQAATTISLYAVSSDTNAFAVQNAQVIVKVTIFN